VDAPVPPLPLLEAVPPLPPNSLTLAEAVDAPLVLALAVAPLAVPPFPALAPP
jgi:hypothetical protein